MTGAAPPAQDSLAPFRRPPSQVMRLARMGSAHPTRLSFLRVLLRRMRDENWQFDRPVWDMDSQGVGRAVYRAIGPARTYSLVAFGHDLPDHLRSDRVIATAWDATFALFDGTPDAADLDRLAANVPLQEAGRISSSELALSRANRSVRLFQHVVDRLAAGQQPDSAEIAAVGYLMRTTAVYGSGKFGAADRALIADRPELAGPFRAEMLSVWLTRAFTVDLVEHLARVRGGDRAVTLDRDLRRGLGVGNATGLGMAPFLVRHPSLLNNWIAAREEALARVRAQTSATPKTIAGLRSALAEAQDNARAWHSEHPVQRAKLADLHRDLALISTEVARFPQGALPWDRLWHWAEASLSLEGQEALLAMMLEPHGALIDDLAETMSADEPATFPLNGSLPVADIRAALARDYGWALSCDYRGDSPDAQDTLARFWYVSEEKLEPRIGHRFTEAGAEREQPLGIGRLAADLDRALAAWSGDTSLADFLLAHPEHRLMARRVQHSALRPFGEIQDNLLAAEVLPIDLLRCKLAFFGARHFDPRSDKWVRISLGKGEPFPDEMGGTPKPGVPAGPAKALPPGRPVRRGGGGVILSQNESENLAMKAARGAGFSWGLAEEAGFAAGWLAARGIDGAAALLHLLTGRQVDDVGRPVSGPGHWTGAGNAPLCPVHLGAALLDRVLMANNPFDETTRIAPVVCPILLLPFLGQAARLRGQALTLALPDGTLNIRANGDCDPGAALAKLGTAALALSILPAPAPPAPLPPQAATLPSVLAATLEGLEALALKTTVPATDTSRQGAGSSGSDND